MAAGWGSVAGEASELDEVFGRYRLRGLLGAGGMGQVFRAYDTELNREVAIKVLPEMAGADAGFEQRFRREARAAAGLGEPHVVPIFDSGQIGGRLFIAMQLIAGTDLGALLKRDGPMPAELAVAVIEQAAAALDAAHRVGLVHRDVKPANLLITPTYFVYLIDFGIARAPGETRLTGTGAAIGTLAYMAPERFIAGQVDHRADVYALTCVLHQCLTGQTPYPAISAEQQMFAHVHGPPPRPSLLRAGVGAGFDQVIAAGMAANPEQRYQSAGQLAAAARAALHSGAPGLPQPVRAYPPEAPTQAAPMHALPSARQQFAPARRRRRGRIAALAAATLLTGAAAATGIVYQTSTHRHQTAATPTPTARTPNTVTARTPSTVTARTPRTVTATIKVGAFPRGVAVDPTTRTTYVANVVDLQATASVIANTTNTVSTTINLGGLLPYGVAVDPTTHTAFITNGLNSVEVIDTATRSVTATINVGVVPVAVAVDPSKHAAYVVNTNDGTVSVIDTTNNTVTATVKVGQSPTGVAVDPTTHTAYITNDRDATVSVINAATNTVTATIQVGKTPMGVAVDPDRHTAYATSHDDATVSVIDTATNTVTGTIKVGNAAWAVAVDPDTHTAYATSHDDATVSVIDTTTNTVTTTIKVGKKPYAVAVDPATHAAYVANSDDGTVSVIEPGR